MQPKHLIDVLGLFRELDPDIPVSTILCFLWLIDNPGMTVSDGVKFLGLSKQSASRNLRNLTDRSRPGKAGVDVAVARPDPQDIRVSRWELNARGKELEQKVRKLLKE